MPEQQARAAGYSISAKQRGARSAGHSFTEAPSSRSGGGPAAQRRAARGVGYSSSEAPAPRSEGIKSKEVMSYNSLLRRLPVPARRPPPHALRSEAWGLSATVAHCAGYPPHGQTGVQCHLYNFNNSCGWAMQFQPPRTPPPLVSAQHFSFRRFICQLLGGLAFCRNSASAV